MTKIQTLLTLWGNRPRRVIDYNNDEDQRFCNSILLALRGAAPEIHEDGPLPDPDSTWFISTYTGLKFYHTNPRPEDVCIEDIAHHLAIEPRFCGAAVVPGYSVAQHCIIVANLVPEPFKLVALMHDSPEAYCKDLPKPLKNVLPRYTKIEHLIWRLAIAPRFNLPPIIPTEIPEVKLADDTAFVTECRDLFTSNHQWARPHPVKPADIRIVPMTPAVAEQAFLEMFYALTSLSRDLATVETPSSDSAPATGQVLESNNHIPVATPNTADISATIYHKSDSADKPASASSKPVAARRPTSKRATPSRKPSKLPAARSLAATPPEPQPTTLETAKS